MRTAIFGGTFDPIHNAHLAVAGEALERFRLDEILFVPAAQPPHKSELVSYEHRYRMVELACRGRPRFFPSRLEEGNRRSYSILTIERLKADRPPEDEIYFLIGADAFSDITTWRRWRDVLRAVDFIVVARPGHHYAVPEGARVHRLETVVLPVSSSGIRDKLARGQRPEELPEAVWDYIRENRLYQAAPGLTESTGSP